MKYENHIILIICDEFNLQSLDNIIQIRVNY